MKKTAFILITIFAVLLIVFILAEITARLIWNGKPPVPDEASKYPYHPDADKAVSYVLLPDFAYENSFILTDKNGFRIDRGITGKKPEGTYRIVFLGDSLILGTRAKINKTIAKIVENGLSTLQYKNSGKIEVLNFGMPGHNIRQYLAVLKKYALKYNPDAIYVGVSIFNDLDGQFIEYLGNGYLTRRSVHTVHGINYESKPPGWLEWNSYLLRFLYYAKSEARDADKKSGEGRKIEGIIRKYIPASCDETDSIWREVRVNMGEIRSIAEKRDALLQVLIFPSTAQVAYPDLPRTPQKILGGILKELGIHYHDFYDEYAFAKEKTGKLPYRDTSSHPDDWMYSYIAYSIRDEFAWTNLGRPENDFGAEINLGDKGDVKYLSFGWADREKLGEAGFRWIASAKARVIFNNFQKEIISIKVICFPFDQCPGQSLSFSLNGMELGTVNIDKPGRIADYTLILNEPIPLQNFNMLDLTPGCVKQAPGDAESMIITPRMISVAVDKIILH